MPQPPLAVDHDRLRALQRRHREHDRLDAPELPLVDVDVAELLAEARDHLQDPFSGPIRRSIL